MTQHYLSDEQIEKLALEHEEFGSGAVGESGVTTHGFCPDGLIAFARAVLAAYATQQAPIDMVLHCPKCGMQHVDMEEFTDFDRGPNTPPGNWKSWDNPPHRSHLCHACDHIWRPADVPTNGVQAVKTAGKADSPIAHPATGGAEAVSDAAREAQAIVDAVADVFSIGSRARTLPTLVMNAQNAVRRSTILRAIEEHFTTTEVGEDGDECHVCPLTWGAEPDEYMEQFRAALASPAVKEAPAVVPEGDAVRTLAEQIDLMVRLFGSLRRMSEMLGIDVGYLSRLRSGEKTDPSDEILKTLGLRRVVTYEPIYRATPLTPRTKSA